MPPGESEETAVRAQLERILSSPGFARNERLSRFLRFVIERHLAGCDRELKETVIATEVFGRRPDYNPKRDAIVRTEAGRLRSRLSEYYLGEGAVDSLIIELPKGGYVPAFRQSNAIGENPVNAGSSPRKHRTLAVAIAVVSALGLAGLIWWVAQGNAPLTIAVLPFEDLNHDAMADYLADGLTDELIRNLSTFDGLAPRSRTSSFALKGRSESIREAGKELDAAYIVEGSVLQSGQHLRINAQLVRTRDDVLLWSGEFDRRVSDTLAVQSEISTAIVNNLRLKLGRGRRRYETSAEAYDLYLRARSLDFRKSPAAFQEVIAKDPSFAPAYAGLAATYAYRTSTVYFDRSEELNKMRAAAEKAIALDPLLAEARDALGMAYARESRWDLAEKMFREAAKLEPNRSETYADYAMYLLLPLGREKEALEWMRVAQRADPLSPDARLHLTWVLFSSHRYGEAENHCGKLLEPSQSECLGRARLGQGRIAEAANIFSGEVTRGVLPGAPIRGYLAYAYARLGRRDEAEKIAEADEPNPFHQVLAFLGLGEKDRALAALERMVSQGPMRLGIALSGPELESLRADPRTKALRKEAGLPE